MLCEQLNNNRWVNIGDPIWSHTKQSVQMKRIGSLRIANINGNINTNVKNLFKTSHAVLILNRFFMFVFMFPFMLVIRKLPNTYLQTGSLEINLLRNALWPPNLISRILDWSALYCLGFSNQQGAWQTSITFLVFLSFFLSFFLSDPIGQRSFRGHFLRKCPMTTKFGQQDSWPSSTILAGVSKWPNRSKVI